MKKPQQQPKDSIILESSEQCEYYAGLSALFYGDLATVQQIQPGEFIVCPE